MDWRMDEEEGQQRRDRASHQVHDRLHEEREHQVKLPGQPCQELEDFGGQEFGEAADGLYRFALCEHKANFRSYRTGQS